MRRLIFVVISIFFFLFGQGCKSYGGFSKSQIRSRIDSLVAIPNIQFDATHAIPISMPGRNLSYGYSLIVRKDSILCNLPYFGRAYRVDSYGGDGGIRFQSTKFSSVLTRKKGMYEMKITTQDTPDKYDLLFVVGDTGYGTLTVNSTNRQSISFYGTIKY